ncbi:MAG: hypothetical protein IT337_08410 [Thermomicrobiales bacterium]|nr:hypothetical protein [Thermomicrobiales bacterium]
MSAVIGSGGHTEEQAIPQTGIGFLRVMLGLQIALGLLWGISMLFFARQIVLTEASGAHIEKIALEGGAHFALVFGAILIWRAPQRGREVLMVLIFLNALWTITDLIYVPLLGLTETDFPAKIIVNAVLAIGLFIAGKRAALL